MSVGDDEEVAGFLAQLREFLAKQPSVHAAWVLRKAEVNGNPAYNGDDRSRAVSQFSISRVFTSQWRASNLAPRHLLKLGAAADAEAKGAARAIGRASPAFVATAAREGGCVPLPWIGGCAGDRGSRLKEIQIKRRSDSSAHRIRSDDAGGVKLFDDGERLLHLNREIIAMEGGTLFRSHAHRDNDLSWSGGGPALSEFKMLALVAGYGLFRRRS